MVIWGRGRNLLLAGARIRANHGICAAWQLPIVAALAVDCVFVVAQLIYQPVWMRAGAGLIV